MKTKKQIIKKIMEFKEERIKNGRNTSGRRKWCTSIKVLEWVLDD